jgi:nucleotide-binding universal stress UspA family protein
MSGLVFFKIHLSSTSGWEFPMNAEAKVTSSTKDSRILLVLDDSEIALRAVGYVAQFAGGRRQFHICLVHVLPPFPPALQEHGGSSNAVQERRLDIAMREEQDRWIAAAKKRAQKSLDQAGRLLTNSGIAGSAVQMLFCEPGEAEETADRLLRMATECHCHTVVVGRQSVSWLHELFSQDIAEELLRRGKGFCIWAVE